MDKRGALQAAQLASGRTAVKIHQQMKRGVNSLATITSTAPWIGILGTLWGIANSFPALGGQKGSGLSRVCENLSHSMIFSAIGLLVALITSALYDYLCTEIEELDLEIKCAALQLVNDLGRINRSTNF